MARGVTINIGLNRVDPAHYGKWSGYLVACESDARDMSALAKANGFEGEPILTEEATADAVSGAIREAASRLEGNDVLFLTYSGHGGQVPDINSGDDTSVGDTWALYDRQLVDDELFSMWGEFKPGVRIFVISDSCHSGTVVRAMYNPGLNREVFERGFLNSDTPRLKSLPVAVQRKAYAQHKQLYDDIQRTFPSGDDVEVQAHVILISGCQDNQESADGDRNGLFTEKLLEVWDGGRFRGGHRALRRQILNRMPPTQSPDYFLAGARSVAFERQRPLTI